LSVTETPVYYKLVLNIPCMTYYMTSLVNVLEAPILVK